MSDANNQDRSIAEGCGFILCFSQMGAIGDPIGTALIGL
jgi:hypothetical protein